MRKYSDIEVDVVDSDTTLKNIIYKLTFPNGKVYIGQTLNSLSTRLSQHCNESKNTIKSRAIQKYKTFKVEILYQGYNLNEKEIEYISFYNSTDSNYGYNMEIGGYDRTKRNQETLDKISKAHKGKKLSEETRKKISEAKKGHTAYNKGVSPSEETKQKMSDSKKGKPSNRRTNISEEDTKYILTIPTKCAIAFLKFKYNKSEQVLRRLRKEN